MAENNICRECGASLPQNAPEGLCPQCLMRVAMAQSHAGPTVDNPARIDGPGTVIGRYELLELLGEGGMGLVYLAEQKEPVRRRVALKIIKPGMDSKQVIARFEAERQALAVLNHPNVAHVFDAGCTETGRPYFVMEYVKGMSITRYCDDNKLTIEQRLRLFEQVCEAVHHAHQKGIIHRDLKPSNILISVQGDRAVPKIIDFGIAKAITQPLTDKTFVTFQGQLLGTPEYMSPEQVDFTAHDVDTRSDIYSLGVVLYELLAGVLPFESESFTKVGLAEIQQTIREQEPASPSIRLTSLGEKARTIAASRGTQVVPLARRLHRELEWIPLKAMRKDRCRRYRSASEMADDIRNYLNGLPLIAGPETTVYRVRKFVAKHAGSVATAALVAAAIVLGLIVSTVMYLRAESMRVRAEQAEGVTEQKAEELRRTLYANSIQLTDAKYHDGNTGRVRELLESCPNDLRGWEWRRLRYISDQSTMTLRGSKAWVDSVAVSPDGKHVLSGGDRDGTIRVWDLATGETVKTLAGHTDAVESLAISPDGKRIVSGSRDKTIKVWDAEAGVEVMTFQASGNVSSVAISPDAGRIVSVEANQRIKVRDAATGEELKTLAGPEFSVAAFSPDGKRIVSGGGDVVRVWDSASGAEIMTLQGHEDSVTSVAFSPDGRHIVSGGTATIKTWDAATGVEVATLRRGEEFRTKSVAFSPDSRFIVSGAVPNAVSVWDVGKGQARTFRGHEGLVICAGFTPDGRHIVSGSSDGTIKVWDATIDKEVATLIGHRGIVFSMAFSPDGKWIVSGGADHTVEIWDVLTGADVMTLRGHLDTVHSTVFSPDGKRLVSGSHDQTIKVWDIERGAEVMTLHSDVLVRTAAISPDGKRIVSGGWSSGRITVWDADTGKELASLRGHEPNNVLCVAFSPDGKRIVSSGTDNLVRVWDTISGAELMTLRGHTKWVASAAFSPDGRLIVSGSDDCMVKVWDASTGAEARTLHGHDSQIKSVGFSPDGRRILSGSTDRTLKVWDVARGTELMSITSGVPLYSAAFSPDGRTIAAAGSENIMLWESAAPADGYEPRRTLEAARNVVDDLYQTHGFYYEVIAELQADKTLDQMVRTRALQIADSRRMQDVEKLAKGIFGTFLPSQDKGLYRAALENAEEASRLEPNDLGMLLALGTAQHRAGQYEDAIKTWTKAQTFEPDTPHIVMMLAEAQYSAGKYDDAVKTLTGSLEISRRVLGEQDGLTLYLLNELACMQAGCPAAQVRNGAEAVKNATKACELTQWKEAMYVDTLAAAYSETGDFDSAVRWQKKAIGLLSKKDPAEWPAQFEERLKLYESGKPYRECP